MSQSPLSSSPMSSEQESVSVFVVPAISSALSSDALTDDTIPRLELEHAITADLISAAPSITVESMVPSALDTYAAIMKSRIERAWQTPAMLFSQPFSCDVVLEQSPQGQVRKINLDACTAEATWRAAIERAIRYAAPFPAPPVASSDALRIELSFSVQPVDPARLATLVSAVHALTYETNTNAERAPSTLRVD